MDRRLPRALVAIALLTVARGYAASAKFPYVRLLPKTDPFSRVSYKKTIAQKALALRKSFALLPKWPPVPKAGEMTYTFNGTPIAIHDNYHLEATALSRQ